MKRQVLLIPFVLVLFGILFAGAVIGADPDPLVAPSLVRNGDFERRGGWNTSAGGAIAPDGNPGQCLRFEGPAGAKQDVFVAGTKLTLTAAVDVRVADVKPEEGASGGYAFAAVYQTDKRGKLVAFHDFVQITGTSPWQRRSYTFPVHPEANFVSLRSGLFQAVGVACFDNWTLVAGTEPKAIDEVRQPTRGSGRPGGTAAVLDEPGMPTGPGASSPKTVAAILQDAGFDVRLLSADELADPALFNASRFDLVAIPTGETFPAKARRAFIEFLRTGGGFIATGGYAFNRLVRKVEGKWVAEEEIVKARLEEAMQAERSLVADGGFEQSPAAPLGGQAADGKWRRTSDLCTVVEESPHEGRFSARTTVPDGVANPNPQFYLDVAAKPDTVYQVSGWIRTHQVAGPGMAFMALYQYDAEGKLVRYRDFAKAYTTSPWQRYDYRFTPDPGVVRLHVMAGLYQARGTAWFDDVRLGDVTGVESRPLNTSTGTPADGLEVSPEQIGAFDASFPLKRACSLRTAGGQHVVREPIEWQGELRGWAASGVIGYDNARWVPLIETSDRYDRPRGAAAAMILNYAGFYAGSSWAYVGIENVDLFEDRQGPMANGLGEVAKFMLEKLYLRNLATDHRFYREGEPVTVSIVVDNRGSEDRRVRVRFSTRGTGETRVLATEVRELDVEAEANEKVEATFSRVDGEGDLCEVAATLGTFTGWNLRAAEYGAEGVLGGLHGSYLPFVRTPEERRKQGDPRPSVLERYPTRAAYLARMTEAALQLRQEGFLLEADVVEILKTARARRLWDDAKEGGSSPLGRLPHRGDAPPGTIPRRLGRRPDFCRIDGQHSPRTEPVGWNSDCYCGGT